MGWLRDLVFRLSSLLRRDRWEADLDEELRAHLEMEIEHRVAAGEDRRSAERAARLALGGVEGIKEGCRESWGASLAHDLWRDVRGALRRLVRYRRYSLVVVLSLGLGLGAALVVFSMVDAVLLQPLPFGEPDRLVRLWERTPHSDRFSTSDANLLDFRERSRSVLEMAAIEWPPPRPALDLGGERVRLDAMGVTPSFFQVLGVSAQLGRTFGEAEERPDGGRVVVLGHDAWHAYFGGDESVYGRTVDLDGHSYEVVGVLPERFRFGAETPEIYLPFRLRPWFERGDRRLAAFGRLAPGVSPETANDEIRSVAADLAAEYPDSNDGWSAELQPLSEALLGPDVERTQWLLTGAVGLLLLLACVNVANLFLAQLADRRDELAMRRALGAGRRRIAALVITEAVVLAMAGAAAGLAAAYLAIPSIRRLDVPLPRLDEMTVDLRVAGVAVLLALGSALLFGLLPALGATRRVDVNRRRQGSGREGGKVRTALVTCEVALATVLAIGAGLLFDSFESLAAVDSGFDAEGVLLAEVDLPPEHYGEASDHARRFFATLVERTAQLSGVEAAGATMTNPFRGPETSNYVAPEQETEQDAFVPVRWRGVTSGLFRTLGIPLIRGRDLADAEPKMETVISADLAARLWPGEDPLGRRMRWIGPEGPLFQVVGVVGRVQDLNLGVEAPPTVYLPQAIMGWPAMTLAVRTDQPAALGEPIRGIVHELDPKLAAPDLSMLAEQRREAMSGPLLSLRVMSAFSAVALLLAAAGVYGVVAYSMSRRRRELGVRLALGASPGRLVGGVTARSLRMVGAGLAAGLVGALLFARLLRSLLYETSPFEPRVLLIVISVLAILGALSAWLPARRAAKLDPLTVLREE